MPDKKALLNPFPGLRPFQSDEEHLFFGRENQTLELLQILRDNRFVGVIGTSGSGKSSLVRCGLLSELYGGSFLDAGTDWEVAVMNPGGGPFRQLSNALVAADIYDSEEDDIHLKLNATLRRSRLGLVEAIRQADLPEGTNFLLVVDQFEEIFRYSEAGEEQGEAADDFIAMLLEAAKQTNIPVYVIITMRSDYIGDCSKFEGLPEEINEGEYLIPRLTREEYKSVIEGPTKVGGGKLAPRLLQRLLNDIGTEADQLPCLQHALMRTWDAWAEREGAEELDLEDYRAIGGMSKALSIHADEIFDTFKDQNTTETATRMFRAITEKGDDNRGIRRPLRLQQLADITNHSIEEVKSVVEPYRQQGVTFLMPPSSKELEPDTVIDISHESLMRVWQRLRNWVEEEAQSARVYRRLVDTSSLWKKSEAGLYHDPDLQIAQSWRDKYQPNEAWADLYGGGFEVATDFLEASEEEGRKAEREKELARQKELEQAKELADARARSARNMRRFAAVVGIVAVIALGAMGFAVKAQKAAEIAKGNAQKAEREAIIAKDNVRVAFAKSDEGLGHSFAEQGNFSGALPYWIRSLEKEPSNTYLGDRIFNLISYDSPHSIAYNNSNASSSSFTAITGSNDLTYLATAEDTLVSNLWIHEERGNYGRNRGPKSLIDANKSTKYVNYGKTNVGFVITPQNKTKSIVKSFITSTHNNSPEEDPTSLTIYGTLDNVPHLGSGEYTMSAWIKPDRLSSENYVFGQSQLGLHHGINQDSSIRFSHWGNDGKGETLLTENITPSTLDDDKWIHVTWTWDGPTKIGKIYINGKLDFESTVENPDNCIGNLMLGSRNSGLVRDNFTPPNGFKGLIDEVTIWNRELTVEQIKDLFVGKSPLLKSFNSPSINQIKNNNIHTSVDDTDGDGFSNDNELRLNSDPNKYTEKPSSLIAYYDFEDTSTEELIDKSGWGNNGVILDSEKINIGKTKGAPKGASSKSSGEFKNGMVDIPGISILELLSGHYGRSVSWEKIGTYQIKPPYDRGQDSEMVQIDNSKEFLSYKVIFEKIRDESIASSVQLSELQFFGESSEGVYSIFGENDKIRRENLVNTFLSNKARTPIKIWSLEEQKILQDLKLPQGARNWGGIQDALDFSPDNKLLAVSYREHSSSSIINTQDGTTYYTVPFKNVKLMRFSPSGSHLLICDRYGKIIVIETKSKKVTFENTLSDWFSRPDWHPSGNFIVSPDYRNKNTAIFNIENGQTILLNHENGPAAKASFSPDGTRLITHTPSNTTFHLWNWSNETKVATLEHRKGDILQNWRGIASFTPDSSMVLTAGDDNNIKLWKSDNGELLSQKLISYRVRGLSTPIFSKDGRRFLIPLRGNSTCYVGKISTSLEIELKSDPISLFSAYVYLVDEGSLKPLIFPVSGVVSGNYNLEDGLIQIGNNDGKISFFDVTNAEICDEFSTLKNLKTFVQSYDKKKIACLSYEGTVAVIDLNAPDKIVLKVGTSDINENEKIQSLNFNKSGDTLWIHRTKGPEAWDISKNEIVASAQFGLTSPYSSTSIDNERIAVFKGSFFRLYEHNNNGKITSYAKNNKKIITCASFDQTGKYLALGSNDGSVTIWSINDRDSTSLLGVYQTQETSSISSLSFSKDSKLIAAGTTSGSLEVITNGTNEIQALTSITANGVCLNAVFCNDSKKLAAIFNQLGNTHTKIWDVGTGNPITGNLSNERFFNKISFTKDNNRLLAWSESPEENSNGIFTSWDIGVMGKSNITKDLITALKVLGGLELNESFKGIKPKNILTNLITSSSLPDLFSKHLSWSLKSPIARSSSPFREKSTKDFISRLSHQNDEKLLSEALRLDRSNPLATSRKAIFDLINDVNLSDALINNALNQITNSLNNDPENNEIIWYNAIVQDIAKISKPYEKVKLNATLSEEAFKRIIYSQEKLGSNSEYRYSLINSAIAKSNSEKNKKQLIIKRFNLANAENRLDLLEEDYKIISNWTELPIGDDASLYFEMFSNAMETKADLFFKDGKINEAIQTLRPLAIASILDNNETLSSSIVKLIEWENLENPPLEIIAADAEWSYLDDGSDPAESSDEWTKSWYPEIDWKKGKAKLGYGNDGEFTRISFGSDPQNKHISYYFRHKFSISEQNKRPILVSDIIRDDGAVVYFNGVEVYRSNMPQGEVTSKTQALQTASQNGEPNERLASSFSIDPKLLKIGDNVICARIHNTNGVSSDLGFQLSLKGLQQLPGEFIKSYFKDKKGHEILNQAIGKLPKPLRAKGNRTLINLFYSSPSNINELESFNEISDAIQILSKLSLFEEALKKSDYYIKNANSKFDFKQSEKTKLNTLKDKLLVKLGVSEKELAEFRESLKAIPNRDVNLSSKLVDLTDHHNINLVMWEEWGVQNDALSTLADTFTPLNGVNFDLRGIVQLNSGVYPNGRTVNTHTNKSWPDEADGIKINNKSSKIHFLMSCTWGSAKDGTPIAYFKIHYDDGSNEILPIIKGSDVVNWVSENEAYNKVGIEKIGWSGKGEIKNWNTHLSEIIWDNPHPDKLITHIDFTSAKERAAPFLVGITLE